MKPIIQLARKPDGLPVVMLVDGPEGPPVTADELAELLRVAYLKLGKSTVDKAIAATSYEDTLARFAKPDPVRAYLAEVCGWAPGEVPADSVLLDSAEQLFCADRGDSLSALAAAERRLLKDGGWTGNADDTWRMAEAKDATRLAHIREAALTIERRRLAAKGGIMGDARHEEALAEVDRLHAEVVRIPGLEQANREAHQAIAALKAKADRLNGAWARLLAAERAHHDHTLLLSDAERDDDMKGPRAAVVEAEEALLALGVDPEDPENLRGQLDRQDDAETAADRNHPPDAEFPNYAAGGAADSLPPALSPDERRMALRCVTWLEAHAVDIEAKVDDECDGCDADAFCAQAETIREAAREMAKAFGVEMPR